MIWTILTSPSLWTGLALLAALFYLFYRYMNQDYGKWEAKGIPRVEDPLFLFGNIKDVLLETRPQNEVYGDFYKKLKNHRIGVFYENSEPVLLINDLDLLKTIAIKDFWHFEDPAFMPPEVWEDKQNDLGLASKFGQEWKSIKFSVTPAFSVSNLKNISLKVAECAKDVVKDLEKRSISASEVHMTRVCESFALDCIGNITLSIDIKSAQNPDTDLQKMAKNIMSTFTIMVCFLLPKLSTLLRLPVVNKKSQDYFRNLIRTIVKKREEDGTAAQYNDVVGIMMKVRDGQLKASSAELKAWSSGDGEEDGKMEAKTTQYMTDEVIELTVVQFFIDGYNTTSNFIALAIALLAQYPDAQEKAYAEAEDVCSSLGEQITTQHISNLKYLEMVFKEVSRMHPQAPVIYRRCTKDWKVPGSDLVIPRGQRVAFPSVGIQNDPKYFTDPNTFDPDRFSPEKKSSIPFGTSLAFGIGPRSCMGIRIVDLEFKILMFYLLRKFEFLPGDKLTNPPQMDMMSELKADQCVKIRLRS